MTRDTAREMAVQIVFGLAHNDAGGEDAIDAFFSEEHYSSLAREDADLYAECPEGRTLDYIRQVVLGVEENKSEIDGLIQRFSSPSWDISRISGTALAVLRVAIFEILYLDDVPAGAAINSAVEIDKKYDEPETVAYVNGCLGGFVRAHTELN